MVHSLLRHVGALPLATGAHAAGTSAGALTLSVVTAVLGSSLVAGLVTAFLTGLRGAATARRDGYAAAIEAMVAWAEFPYRVRRRTDDEPETLHTLAELGHDLQERLARHRSWVAAESAAVGGEFDAVIGHVREDVGAATAAAWKAAPVNSAAEMNVGQLYSPDVTDSLDRLQRAVRWRFGVRRLAPSWWASQRIRRPAAGSTASAAAAPPAQF